MRPLQTVTLLLLVLWLLALMIGAAAQDQAPAGKAYGLVDGKADARTFNGYRRYNAGCNHCHGPDGVGSTFGPSLVGALPDIDVFRRIVREGKTSGTSVMQGFADDPNIAPYVDDLYAYLQARADGASAAAARPVWSTSGGARKQWMTRLRRRLEA
jgi:mono/diheme cytochrome c family protein